MNLLLNTHDLKPMPMSPFKSNIRLWKNSFDCYFIVNLEVLKLVLIALFLLVYNFCLISKSIPEFWLLWPRFWLLKHLIEVRLLSGLILIYRKVHRCLFCTRLWYLGLLKYIWKRFIRSHLPNFHPIWEIVIHFSRGCLEDDIIFGKILLYWSTQFL